MSGVAGAPRARAIALGILGGALLFASALFGRAEGPPPAPTPPPPESALALFAGAFRPLATDVLWMRLEGRAREGRPEEVLHLASLVLALDPRFEQAWYTAGFTLAVDMPAFEESPAIIWRWRRQGLLLLREGAARNPASWLLRHRAAFVLEHHVAGSPLEPMLRADRRLDPEGRGARSLALAWYREAAAIEGHAPYVDEAVGRLGRE